MIEYSQPEFCSVEIDDYKGGQLAAEYLIRKGHRRVAFMARSDIPEHTVHSPFRRMEGFRDALVKAGIELSSEYVCLIPETQEDIYKATVNLLQRSTPPTAVFGALDVYALGVLKAARQIGVSVPQQLAIIGFDDLDMSAYADLTTIRQHLDESGRIAIEVLLAQIEDDSRPLQHIQLPLTLIERLTS